MIKKINVLNVQTLDEFKSYVLQDVENFKNNFEKNYPNISISYFEDFALEVEFCDAEELLFLKNSNKKYTFEELDKIIEFSEILELYIETNVFKYDEVYYFRTEDDILTTYNCIKILNGDEIEYNFIHGDNCGKIIYSFDILYNFLADDFFEIIEECEFFKEYMKNPKFDEELKLLTYENTIN